MLNVIMLRVVLLNFVTLIVVMLRVLMVNVGMLNVVRHSLSFVYIGDIFWEYVGNRDRLTEFYNK